MRIKCPYCGERSLDEFAYHGDATVTRPQLEDPDAIQKFVAYAYERSNPAGAHRELWYHAAGCHVWLVVTRDTTNHSISGVELAREVARQRNPAAEGEVT